MPDRRLILASTSPYRRELLERLGLPFETAAPNVDEKRQPDETPATMVARLARAKASAIAGCDAGLVIGSDQCAALDGRPIGKPGNAEQAVAQLTAASGRTVSFLTAVCVLDAASGQAREALDETVVHFRVLDEAEIRRYVARERPLDCAGSFKSEGLGIALFERIDSRDPTALMGLPLIALAGLLREAGLQLP